MRYSSDTGEMLPNAAEQHDMDLAEDELQNILNLKRQLFDFFCDAKSRFPNVKLNEAKDIAEEIFNDAFYQEYHRQRDRACSIEWPTSIPSFEALALERRNEERKTQARWRNNPQTQPQVDAIEADFANVFGKRP